VNSCICEPGEYDPACPFVVRVLKAVKAYAVPEIPNDGDGALRRSPSASLGRSGQLQTRGERSTNESGQ
jgi:hypothetical protein